MSTRTQSEVGFSGQARLDLVPSGSPLDPAGRGVKIALDAVLAVTWLAALTAIVILHGYGDRPLPWPGGPVRLAGVTWSPREVMVLMVMSLGGVLVLDRLLRLVLARSPRQYFQLNWLDYATIAVGALGMAAAPLLHGQSSTFAMAGAVAQVYVVFSLILRGVGINLTFAESSIHPGWLLIGSFAALAMLGSGLLMLPVARTAGAVPWADSGRYYIDALFTSTSAVCVTGLTVADVGKDFTPFGQAVILCLIQAGGLGIMIFGTSLALLVGRGLNMRQSNAIGSMLSAQNAGNLKQVASFVVLVTLAIEAVGAGLLFGMFYGSRDAFGHTIGAGAALWHSVFHSISAFCNAGFVLHGDNLMPWSTHWQVMGVVAPLIILGGLGFPVLQDVVESLKTLVNRMRRQVLPGQSRAWAALKLSLHSKIVLTTSAILIIGGAAAIWTFETIAQDKRAESAKIEDSSNQTISDWQSMTPSRRAANCVFHSISARTAGFNTVDLSQYSDASKATLVGLMIVGGSPAGTAGGMKTVTLALLVMIVISNLRLRAEVEGFKRSIAAELVQKTITVTALYLLLVTAVTLGLCLATRSQGKFLDLLFEASSACGTVGLSTGVTSQLQFTGKAVLIGGMFLGRVGLLTFLLAMTARMRHVSYSYPRENVIIG